jgi:uncharacterized protein (TIGR03435 family)
MLLDHANDLRADKLPGRPRRVAVFLARLSLGFLMLGVQETSRLSAQQAPATTGVEPPPSFDVASIKPARPGDGHYSWNSGVDRLSIENYTLRRLIRTAYGLKSDSQVLGGPDWIGKQAFDIEAKYGDAEIAKLQKMAGRDRFREAQLALQTLLADRFQLQITQDKRNIPVYALVVTKTGARLTQAAVQLDSDGKPKAEQNHSLHGSTGHVTATAMSMGGLADWFVYAPECDRVVVDRTGLTGEYDFKLDWTQDNGQGIPPDAPLPGIFTALREQLGLELKPDKAPVDVVIVKSASEPELE